MSSELPLSEQFEIVSSNLLSGEEIGVSPIFPRFDKCAQESKMWFDEGFYIWVDKASRDAQQFAYRWNHDEQASFGMRQMIMNGEPVNLQFWGDYTVDGMQVRVQTEHRFRDDAMISYVFIEDELAAHEATNTTMDRDITNMAISVMGEGAQSRFDKAKEIDPIPLVQKMLRDILTTVSNPQATQDHIDRVPDKFEVQDTIDAIYDDLVSLERRTFPDHDKYLELASRRLELGYQATDDDRLYIFRDGEENPRPLARFKIKYADDRQSYELKMVASRSAYLASVILYHLIKNYPEMRTQTMEYNGSKYKFDATGVELLEGDGDDQFLKFMESAVARVKVAYE